MNEIVKSKRIQYTASQFAKHSLLYLQEVGFSKTIKQHSNIRNNMTSFLFFIVIEGNGSLNYKNTIHELKTGDCVFIDCHYPYINTSNNWHIAWVHFNGKEMNAIYQKYINRNGHAAFNSFHFHRYNQIINEIYQIANSENYIKDMAIFHKLSELLYTLMEETVYIEENKKNNKYDLNQIKKYIDDHYIEDIALNQLSDKFFINKFYLTRIFKEKYGSTINSYIAEKRITKAKELLRFSSSSIEDIALSCGVKDPNYFSRLFKKIEGISPKEYKKMW